MQGFSQVSNEAEGLTGYRGTANILQRKIRSFAIVFSSCLQELTQINIFNDLKIQKNWPIFCAVRHIYALFEPYEAILRLDPANSKAGSHTAWKIEILWSMGGSGHLSRRPGVRSCGLNVRAH